MTSTPPSKADGENGPIQAMVVGASDVVAGLVSKILESDPRIDVAARPANGPEAVSRFRTLQAEAVVMDIGGAGDNALTTLSRLLRIDPHVRVIMVSTLTYANVKTAMEGLERGAAEYMQTPAAHTKERSLAVFRHNLAETVLGLGQTRRRAGKRQVISGKARVADKPIELRRESMLPPEVLVIGSSTGGPQALLAVIKALPDAVTVPILIAQHMPPGFTASLAANIEEKSGRPSAEGKDGEILEKGRVYMAPGDYHMVIERSDGKVRIRINQEKRGKLLPPFGRSPVPERRLGVRRQDPGHGFDRHGQRRRGRRPHYRRGRRHRRRPGRGDLRRLGHAQGRGRGGPMQRRAAVGRHRRPSRQARHRRRKAGGIRRNKKTGPKSRSTRERTA